KELKEKKDKGEKLSEMEAAILQVQSQPMTIPNWGEYVKQQSGDFFKPEYVKNVEKLKKFLTENKKYMYATPDDFYSLKIDEDIKKMGIGNNDKQLLQQCITLLKNGKDKDLANRVLQRYTGLEKNPQEWEQWFGNNSSKLFFTEAGGYKWLIDTTK
ncbi:MAG TPA: hypothetical protein VFQ56_04105, partial [Flavobacterium sp.]|nr:hypothetical protein [Flavobacterium sp.]